MLENSKSRLCSDREETVTHIKSDCSKLTQKKYRSKLDWVGKVIHWEKLKFYHTDKWYIHKQESVLKNETHEILWDFEVQANHPI